jgi:hypothetical protein
VLHADEGTLHELIDGSLPPAERRRMEEHLARCEGCRARLAEARDLVRLTAGLVEALDLVAPDRGVPRPTRRRIHPRVAGWAASIVAAIGIGFAARPLLQGRAPANAPQHAGQVMPSAAAPAAAAAPNRDRRMARNEPAAKTAAALDAAVPASALQPPSAPLRNDAVAGAAPSAPMAPPTLLRTHPEAAVALDAPLPGRSTRITLEEAVHQLGGSIRLIDGLEPLSVERTPGASMPGGDPSRDAVTVRYQDPRFGIVELAQQRLAATAAADAEASLPRASARMAGPAAAPARSTTADTLAPGSISWSDPQGFRLVLTATAPAESLVALRARVR